LDKRQCLAHFSLVVASILEAAESEAFAVAPTFHGASGEQFRLEGWRHFANFIQKQRTTGSLGKEPRVARIRTGESAKERPGIYFDGGSTPMKYVRFRT